MQKSVKVLFSLMRHYFGFSEPILIYYTKNLDFSNLNGIEPQLKDSFDSRTFGPRQCMEISGHKQLGAYLAGPDLIRLAKNLSILV